MSSDPTSAGPASVSFSLDIGDDLLAEALAAVERREDEARARKRAADPDEMEQFAADLEVGGPLEADGLDADSNPDPFDEVGDEDEVELDFGDELAGAEVDADADLAAETLDDDPDAESGDRAAAAQEGEALPAPSDEELGLGEDANAAMMRELTRLQARVAAVGAEREEALDLAAVLEERLLESEAARETAAADLEETRLRLRKYKVARKRQLEDARRSEAALTRARDRANRAEDRVTTAELARDEAGRSLHQAMAGLADAERTIEAAHERRRRELAEQRRSVSDRCWKSMFPVLDNLQLALSHASAGEGHLLEGLRMVERQFLGVLANAGVTPVDASTGQPFDPAVHEAVERTETDEVAPDAVVHIVQTGFLADGRLLRPARVSVATPPPAPALAPAEPAPDPTSGADGEGAPDDSAASAPLPDGSAAEETSGGQTTDDDDATAPAEAGASGDSPAATPPDDSAGEPDRAAETRSGPSVPDTDGPVATAPSPGDATAQPSDGAPVPATDAPAAAPTSDASPPLATADPTVRDGVLPPPDLPASAPASAPTDLTD